jgi:hypothetical protein
VSYRPLLICLLLVSCNYWRTTPRGDVAPAQWGASEAPGPVSDANPASVGEQRLRNLEALRRDGIISEVEYRERRKKVLADAF